MQIWRAAILIIAICLALRVMLGLDPSIGSSTHNLRIA
jgi:hypothetical protein